MENYVGKRLDGRYEIMEIIGVGGMAVVYKAFDNMDQRIVAVKILKDEFLANDEFKRRFKNESKAISVLSHKNIVMVFDVSYGNKLQYIVMEHVDGIPLKEYVNQQGTVDPREAIYFVTQILRALQHAHDKGIVHRDIKPQNIMLQSDGTIKVTDFGIARFSRSETRTMTDGAIGSVHYISPEQAKGSVTDAKTDLYSVGVMMYEMLTGRLPFQSDNAVSVALMQLQNDPEKPRDINPDIPVGLEQIIMRAMQKNQNDRYQSASEILMDLEAYKKNPNIKFDYMYNTENNDEKVTTYESPSKEPASVQPVEDNDYNYEEVEYEPSEKGKKATIAVLGGVLGALVIFAIVLIMLFSSGGNKLDVPNLIDMNFYSEVDNNPAYTMYKFDPVIDSESEEEEGTIIDQKPRHGKISREEVITVYIAGPKNKKEVPDVTNKLYSAAESMLKAKGFDVKIVKEKNENIEIGKVIRTVPKAGEEVAEGSTITMYVATNQDVEPVDIPDLLGLTLSEAREVLGEVGLLLDEDGVTYRSSSKPKGTIIGYEGVGEEALPGTEIVVFISTGKEATEEDTTDEETTEEETTTSADETTTKPTKPSDPSEEPTTKPSSTKPSTTKPKPTKPTATKPSTTKTTEPSTSRQTTEPTTAPTSAPTTAPTSAPTTAPSTTQTTAPSSPDVNENVGD